MNNVAFGMPFLVKDNAVKKSKANIGVDPEANSGPQISFGILTISDSCSFNSAVDESGPMAVKLVEEGGYSVALRDCVPDDQAQIHALLMKWIASGLVHVIVTTGGTGLSGRDVTPETVLKIISQGRRLSGLEHALYGCSFQHTPMAALSRFVAGVRDQVLLIAIPGSPKAVSECIPLLLPIVKHAVEQIRGWSVGHNRDKVRALSLPLLETSTKSAASRPRESPFPMISVSEAQAKIFQAATPMLGCLTVEPVFYKNAVDRVLGCSLRAQHPIPPFDASVMDGYAVRFSRKPGRLRVVGVVCAGDPQPADASLARGTCMRVNTGGPLPPGTDAVVPVEHTRLISTKRVTSKNGFPTEEEERIEVLTPPRKVGEFIRSSGTDLSSDYVFQRGLRLGPAEIGLLAGAGLLSPCSNFAKLLADHGTTLPPGVLDSLSQGGYIPCIQQPRIGILSTGNELVDPTSPFESISIIDSNLPALSVLLRKHGFPNALDFGIVSDQQDLLIETFQRAFGLCDILITTGGVSMGEHDLVATVLAEKFGAIVHFSRIFMKPGKPTKFATVPLYSDLKSRKVLVFCLPGNPVSAFVTTHLFVLPLLRQLELRPETDWTFPCIRVRLLHSVNLGDRPDYRRARLVWQDSFNDDTVASASIPCATCEHLGDQMSSRLASCVDFNLLLVLPPAKPGQNELPVDSVVDALVIST
ncbi:hypothetical protein CRM22_009304 [Opisthorchis felineus]|uniref:MoaB/Mog domain-containing protein n=1 Tax=Opisthorchis felineus TaxID=147828 RepID=A0A4S2LF32_OPIFE|nr:hypothetical protein CRM22_009304 [Opisthorchis felineus]